ncbi:hypothetical protein, partial [Hungatella effluvii]|uniref:hypothetical protein n=1 Tax=Hungatella effluvii TaxID=1096246 RepID=UPI002A822EF3
LEKFCTFRSAYPRNRNWKRSMSQPGQGGKQGVARAVNGNGCTCVKYETTPFRVYSISYSVVK